MDEGQIQEGVILTFAVEGTETIVAAADIQDGLTASVEAFAASATSAYAQANAAQRSLIDAYMQQAKAAAEAGGSVASIRANIQQSIGDLERYAVAWATGANASLTGSAAAAEAAGILRVQLAGLAAAQEAQAAAAKAAAAEQAALAKMAGNPARLQSYLAEADAIVTANEALGVQIIQLEAIEKALKGDVASFAAMGAAGVNEANASSEALTLVQAALASIAAEQKDVIAGMAGIAAAATLAKEQAVAAAAAARLANSDVAIAGYLAQADAIVTSNAALGIQAIQLQEIAGKLKADTVAFAGMGEEGVAAADASAEALALVEGALASIAAEQRLVIAGMAGMGATAATSGAEIEAAMLKAGAKIAGVNTGLAAMATTMLPLAAGFGFAMLTKHSIESMAELEKFHQRMGIATEDLSVLSMAADKVGIKMNDVAIGMRMFDRHVDEAVEGRGKLVINNFKSIGLSMDDLKHKDPMTLFLRFATAISQIEDPTVRSAKATELMGRASERLIPFMNLLAGQGFSKLTAEATALGIVVSGSAAKSALEFEKNWAMVKLQLTGVGNVIATSILPLMKQMAEPPKDRGFLDFLEDVTFWLKAIITLADASLAAMKMLSGYSLVRAAAGMAKAPFDKEHSLADSSVASFQTLAKPTTQFQNLFAEMWGDKTTSPVVPKGDVYDRGAEQEQVDKAAERLAISRDQLDISTKQAAISGAETGSQARQLEYQLKLLQIQKQIDSSNRSIDSMKGVDPASKAQLKVLELIRAHQEMIAAANDYNKAETSAVTAQNDSVLVARDQLAVQRLRTAALAADNVMQAIGLDYAAKRRDIENDRDQKIRSINSQLLQKSIDPGTAGALTAGAELMAQSQLTAAELEHKQRIQETVRAQEESLRTLQDQLATQKLQTAEAGGTSALMKEQLSLAEKQLSIQHELDAATRRITAPGPSALPKAEQQKQLAIETAIAEQKFLTAALDAAVATNRIVIAEAAITRELDMAAESQQRNLEIAKNSLAIELLNRHAVMTTADVQKEAALARANEELQLAEQKAAIYEDQRKKILEQDMVIFEAQQRATATGSAIDMAAVDAAFAHKKAINDATNAAIVNAEVATQSKIGAISYQSIQKTNAAWAEARYSKQIMDAQAMANAAQDLATVFGDPMMQVAADFLHFLVDSMKKAADQANEIWRTVGDNITQGFSTLFSDLSRGSGLSAAFKDMGDSFESNFGRIIENRIKVWADELTKLAQGQPLTDSNGKPVTDAAGHVQFKVGPDRNAQMQLAAFGAAQIGIAGYAGGSGHGQASTSALSGGVTGATLGFQLGAIPGGVTAIAGAAIGAVVGIIASVIGSAVATAQRQSEYLYGKPQFVNGQAVITNEKNINAQKSQELTAQLQDSFNTAWNGFVTIIGKLGGAAPGMPSFMMGDFQPNPSANWEKHFQQYLTDTLPLAIAAMFKVGMEKSFVASGLTSEAFDKFWQEANALDPTKRMQFWNDLSDGIVSFAHAQAVFDGVKRLGGSYEGAKFDDKGNAVLGIDNSFMASLRIGAKQVYDIARDMVSLTGPDRIAAFKQMGASVDAIAASFAQFIQQVGESLKNVRQQFTDAYLQHALDAAGEVRDAHGNIIHQNDPNAQARILEQAYSQNLYKIQNASKLGLSPQEVEALTQQSIDYLNRIFALDPTAAANDWWMKQMSILQSSSEAALQLMGDAATTEMQKFLDSIKPFKDYMLGIPVEIDPSIIALEKEFDGLAAAIAALTVSIKDHTPDPGSGGGGGGSPDPDGGGDGTIKHPNSVGGNVTASSYMMPGEQNVTIVNINGGVFVGMSEFQEAVNNGVALAQRETPQKFLPSF